MKTILAFSIAAWSLFGMTSASFASDPENTLYLHLTSGRVVIEMRPDLAPRHVARIKELVRKGFYDKVVFHRVIAGFMAQTGDPTGTGMGGSGQNLKAEFSPPSKARHERGAVSMARAQSPNSADSQFFICFAPTSFLDGKYTIWGQVIEGMEHVDAIKKGDEHQNGTVDTPDHILSLKVAADVKEQGEK
ncbi:MAG: peptidylprolyl isomerase [Rhodospirillaceae bacterium]|nr:MAG: peptidylprolyl isomerase [Rhodospirillaceae bacterium]